jgi:transcriptional regulator with XRE-family HTH domain
MSKQIESVYRLLGERVEMMRNTLGWTQADLATRTRLSRASIANLETGRQRLMMHHVEVVAHAFMTTPKHLMKGIWT